MIRDTKYACSITFNDGEGLVECTFMPPMTPAEYSKIYPLLRLPMKAEQLLEQLKLYAMRWGLSLAVHHWRLR